MAETAQTQANKTERLRRILSEMTLDERDLDINKAIVLFDLWDNTANKKKIRSQCGLDDVVVNLVGLERLLGEERDDAEAVQSYFESLAFLVCHEGSLEDLRASLEEQAHSMPLGSVFGTVWFVNPRLFQLKVYLQKKSKCVKVKTLN